MPPDMPDLNWLPSYQQLPVTAGAPPGSAWWLFGRSDDVGLLNLLTSAVVKQAASCIRQGKVFSLNLPLTLPDPPLFRRGALQHHLLARSSHSRDEYIDSFWPQASSQWDGLRHMRNPEHGFYNGVQDQEVMGESAARLGIEHWARRGIAGRGVLLDVAHYRESRGAPLDPSARAEIPVSLLRETQEAEDVEIRPADILLVRTGWTQFYLSADRPTRERLARDMQFPGLAPGREMAEYLWNLHICAVAADCPALEAYPWGEEPLHLTLIPLFGMPIGELWYLEELAKDCAEDGLYDFFLVSSPLHLLGGVGSPPNALAVK